MEVFLGRGAAIFFKGETLIQIPAVGFGSDLVWRWHALERRKKKNECEAIPLHNVSLSL